jgi:glucose/mannose-6-phosphate isomerase
MIMVSDSGNMIEVLRRFPSMIEEATHFAEDISFPKEFIENIVVLGMGGSGYTGDLLKVYLQDTPLHVHVVKDYILPKFVDRKSLVFAISYSGNTEETVTAYRTALKRGCRIISVSSGGKLKELANLNKNAHIEIPKGIQPRLSTPYLFISVLSALQNGGLVDEIDSSVEETIDSLKGSQKKLEAFCLDLAKKLKGKVPIIYSSQRMFCISEKWKTDINENAKVHAFYNMFPEFNHNEISAYEHTKDIFHTILISDIQDHERVKRRFEIFKKIMKKYKVQITEVSLKGDNFMTRLLTAILMGLYLGYFMALEQGTDPTPVEVIENLKKELEK